MISNRCFDDDKAKPIEEGCFICDGHTAVGIRESKWDEHDIALGFTTMGGYHEMLLSEEELTTLIDTLLKFHDEFTEKTAES